MGSGRRAAATTVAAVAAFADAAAGVGEEDEEEEEAGAIYGAAGVVAAQGLGVVERFAGHGGAGATSLLAIEQYLRSTRSSCTAAPP